MAMNVCHFSTVHPEFDVRILYRECASLVRLGYSVDLIIPAGQPKELYGVQIIPARKFHSKLWRILFGSWLIMPKLFGKSYDIYHFHDPELIPLGLLLRFVGKRVIFDIHENVARQIASKQWLPASVMFAKMYRLFDWLAARFFYLVLAENSYVKVYDSIAKHPLTIVLNMPDVDFFSRFRIQDRRHADNAIFYIGGVSVNRGILEVLEAVDLLRERGKEVTFHCVGRIEDNLMTTIESLPTYQRVKDQVKFYGGMGLEEGYEISRSCKVGIAILRPIENYVESYSTKIFEYMAVGLPFLTSNFELYQEVVRRSNAGVCVDPLSPEKIADEMAALLENPERSTALGQKGIKAAEEVYRWQHEADKLHQLYQSIIPHA